MEWVRVEKKKVKIHFLAPMRVFITMVFKTVTFRKWLDDETYNYTLGQKYFVYNESNFCSKYIEKPDENLDFTIC